MPGPRALASGPLTGPLPLPAPLTTLFHFLSSSTHSTLTASTGPFFHREKFDLYAYNTNILYTKYHTLFNTTSCHRPISVTITRKQYHPLHHLHRCLILTLFSSLLFAPLTSYLFSIASWMTQPSFSFRSLSAFGKFSNFPAHRLHRFLPITTYTK
ncbi:uncharacterized protein KLLA0_B12606g [Kluyveromyces lactis]|uniref:KLLA0B12606p n=1 Tax=Kluyveromyces lactis (strain ATCC 8585 / CBS 2359 / DSM 70799 / NBRC 1267 / NRRL Y-1140 / WM37) TaxID=284590 RepID=Q6CVE7_KLULA|nr:uncharacterized protein KLLA0_B12606g [Kluyveromyces lactis]CAH02485.1 KLLA0B12606p [Kluyveromyces lactis]|eukprot:XP_452092.1 uncharacterized protein KLLA0_B12606g [Kluyveromyces lactis]